MSKRDYNKLFEDYEEISREEYANIDVNIMDTMSIRKGYKGIIWFKKKTKKKKGLKK